MSTEQRNRITMPLRRWLVLALGFGFIAPVMITALVTYQYIGLDGGASVEGWQQDRSPYLVPSVTVVSLVFTLVATAWFLGRMVARPLAATEDAARQISTGDLSVQLPSSRVREVAGVNEAFARMTDDLSASLGQQAQLEQSRRFQIGAIAHDLRTPLFSLRGYLEGLERGVADTPEKRAQYLARAREKADGLERMVADLSDFTRLEYLEQMPNREPVDLPNLLQQLVDGVQPVTGAKDVSVTLDVGTEPCMINVDSHLLTRAIGNLLDNAIRHTPSGGSVRVGWADEPGQVRFAVQDTGPGIARADLQRVFEPLYRGDDSRNQGTGGSGLGLTIARRIIRAHGGELWAENRHEGGAVLNGLLPKQE